MIMGRKIAALVAVTTFASVPVLARADEPPPQPSAPAASPAPVYPPAQPPPAPESAAPAGPRVIVDWEEGEPIPPGYHQSTRVRRGPAIGGAVVFGVFYLISTLAASVAADTNRGSTNPLAALWVPGIGPFIQISNTSLATADWALVMDGLAQTGGLVLLAYGIMSPRPVLVRNDLTSGVVVRPMVLGRNGGGVGLAGSF